MDKNVLTGLLLVLYWAASMLGIAVGVTVCSAIINLLISFR